ncbi:adenylyl-sulfate kinase [Pseudomonas sp. LFM046]|uniref:adenylyl-sulfate kinase n=1 Tax=Pseudomonas sp. LFM046 TaxID=1608357 RepID=UPI000B1AA496|nr:adenylyl-sulfate kinase [Pseudomonas sp. LFM046]
MSEAHPHTLAVPVWARSAIKHQRPRCIWLTGLSGAGKSTLVNALELKLNARGLHTYVLDGDNLRRGLCRDLGMSVEDRQENIRRIAEVARLMVDAGLIVIVSAIAPFRADREAARRLFNPGEFYLVYVSTSFDACARRDPKGLYRAALEGRLRNFTGLDSPYEPPLDADWEVDTEVTELPVAARELLGFVLSN